MPELTEFDPELWAEAARPVREPRTIMCGCGHLVTLADAWANECACGELYNGGGQRLAPVHYWGEETGEHFV